MKTGLSSKLSQVIEQIPRDVLYDHFAGWIRRLYNSSPECEKIAREVAEEIVNENPNKAFRRMFERIGMM